MKKIKKKHLFIITLFGLSYNLTAQIPGSLNENFNQVGWNDSIVANNNGVAITKTMIQPDGKIIVVGETNFSNEGVESIIVRYNIDGSVDDTYGGGDGIFRSWNDLEIYMRGNGTAMQSDGKVIVGGDFFYISERLIRVNTDGSLDTSFGEQGMIDIQRPNDEYLYHIAVQSDNKIIVCGKERLQVNGSFIDHVFLSRFSENGVVDASFGIDGKVSYITDDFSFSSLQINDLLVLPNDKVIVNISFTKFSNYSVMLTRFNANGTMDSAFGNAGHVIKSELTSTDNFRYSTSAIQTNGSIVSIFTASDENNFETPFSDELFRVNEQGVLDNSFSISIPNGKLFPDFSQVQVAENRIFLFDKNNLPQNQGDPSFDKIFCFDLSGNPVSSFGNNGVAIIDGNDIPITYYSSAAVISNSGTIFLSSYSEDIEIPEQRNLVLSSVNGFNQDLSILDQEAEDNLFFFPNPTTGIVSILNSENKVIDKIEVVDVLGKVVYEKYQNTTQIDISSVSKGIYIINLYTEGNKIQKRIIKN